MLLLCITGLPLIFHHEIGHLLGTEVEPVEIVHTGPRARLDDVLAAAHATHPDRFVQFASQEEDDDRLWFVTLTPSPAPTSDFKSIAVDARTATLNPQQPVVGEGFMNLMLRLHVDLFADLPGKLFLGAMGLLLVLSIVSGVVVYGPFMRKLPFATVRQDRQPRMRWLDLHNLLGIVTLAWALVVGATGVINTWADLLVKLWQFDQLGALVAPYKNDPPIDPKARAPVEDTMRAALAAAPGKKIAFIAFPGTAFSSPHHDTYFLRGNTPLTSRLLKPVLVDARTGAVTAAPDLPWYLTTLLISQPLHFGDYGGMPLKIVWALLDIVTIVVLSTGLYLWLARRKTIPRSTANGPTSSSITTLES
jgi:uncharacterized iron-regulated membrane protein